MKIRSKYLVLECMLIVFVLEHTFAQQDILGRRISLEVVDQSVIEIIRMLEIETGYFFNYSNSDVDQNRRITKNYRDVKLDQLLKDLWRSNDLVFRVQGKAIEIQKVESGKNKKVGAVSGKVTDQDGVELPGVTVQIVGTLNGDITNADGNYEIAGIPVGQIALEFSYTGFENQTKTINVKANKTSNSRIQLKESVSELEEVVVVGESVKTKLENTAQAITIIELKEAKLKTPDLGEILARTEGVAIQRAGGLGSGTRISLNGLTDDQIRIFIDEIPLESAGYTFDIANVPVSLIDRVEVYKGVVPIRFGADALGGAVNLATPDVTDGLSGSVSYQVGSFGTHRFATNINNGDGKTGFFVKGSGFYDFARNDYKINVQVADESGRPVDVTVPRFHDRYRAYGTNITVGIRKRLWAEELSVTGYLVHNARQIQNNVFQTGLPFGEGESFGNSLGVNMTYSARLVDSLSITVTGGYGRIERRLQDLSNCRYNWFGECFLEVPSRGEFTANGTDQTIWDDNAFARIIATWKINPRHVLKLIAAPTYNFRTGEDALITQGTDLLEGESELTTFISGLEYQFGKEKDRVKNQMFIKHYRQRAYTELPPTIGEIIVRDTSTVSNYGFGNVTRIEWMDWLVTKLSYERTIRLPRRDEILGDGQFVVPNTELEPEQSHNVNLQFTFTRRLNARVSWSLRTNGFLRATENLITLIAVEDVFNRYVNIFNATSLGLEFNGQARFFGGRLRLDTNSTYQSFRNTTKEGAASAFKGDRIPNRPYFFANANASYLLDSPLRRGDRVNLFTNTRYVHSFFRSWESAGIREFAAEIPSQTTYGAGLTYETTTENLRLAFTAEVQNLTNATVFDFFGVQRPGRAFYIKLTTQL